jgi:ribosomal protein L40E
VLSLKELDHSFCSRCYGRFPAESASCRAQATNLDLFRRCGSSSSPPAFTPCLWLWPADSGVPFERFLESSASFEARDEAQVEV